jgi:hypothetical protein
MWRVAPDELVRGPELECLFRKGPGDGKMDLMSFLTRQDNGAALRKASKHRRPDKSVLVCG